MITFVTGKPGDGKSMYGMKLMVDSLLHTNKVIVTNFAVRVPELRAYLVLKGWKPKPGNDLAERLVILEHEEVFEFYRYRSGGYVLPPSPDWKASRQGEDDEGKKIKKLSRFLFLRAMTEQLKEMKKNLRALRPVEYHIDEAHDYFSAREWTDTGRGILWYASKHRHLHDEVVFYTQVMKNVESQLRGLAQGTVRARNQIRMSWGPFRKAPIFRLYHYYDAPEDVSKCVPYTTSVMQLDRDGLCRTYNTAGALSVHTKPEEVKNKAPLPYWALPVAAACLVLGVVVFMISLPLMAGKVTNKAMGVNVQKVSKEIGVPVPGGAAETLVKRSSSDRVNNGAESAIATDLPRDFSAKVTGVMMLGGEILVATPVDGYSRVTGYIGQGMYELANGSVVRKADVIRGTSKKMELPDVGFPSKQGSAPRSVELEAKTSPSELMPATKPANALPLANLAAPRVSRVLPAGSFRAPASSEASGSAR